MPNLRKADNRCVPLMKTMQKKELISFLNTIIEPFGFARKGDTWRKESEELTQVVNLQKSSFGNLFYINYGFNIKGLDYDGTTLHVFRGLTTKDDNGGQLLDFDNALVAEHRHKQIAEKLQALLSGELKEINTISELKKSLEKREHLNDVPIKVKDFLGLPTS